jgi:hypothetical protein
MLLNVLQGHAEAPLRIGTSNFSVYSAVISAGRAVANSFNTPMIKVTADQLRITCYEIERNLRQL